MNSQILHAPSGLVELDAALKGGFIKPSNLLMIGAPLCEKRELGMYILSEGLQREEAAIYISTSQTAEEVSLHWREYGLRTNWEQENRTRFVDCYSRMLGANSPDTESIRRIPSILDYTKLSVTVNEMCSGFVLKNTGVRLMFDSLSSFLIYSSLQTVMRFLHVFMGQLRKQNVLAFFVLEEGAHDEVTANQLKTFSNGAIRVSENERTFRLEGFSGYANTLIPFELTAAKAPSVLSSDSRLSKSGEHYE
jgi:KaiC/GvpD/RAD55 family RecA-like ATPase